MEADLPPILPPILPPEEGKRKRETRKANYMKKILNNDEATKSTSFSKRKPTLKKKASELQTLCDVSVCLVCYDANGNVETWPENQPDVVSAINEYKKVHDKRSNDIIGFSKLKKKKLADKVGEEMKRNCTEVARELSKLFDGLSRDALADSLDVLDSKLKSIKEKVENVNNVQRDPPVWLPLAIMVDNKAGLEFEFVDNMDLRVSNRFGDAGTGFGVMPESNNYKPFCHTNCSDGLSMLEGSDFPRRGYIDSNPMVGFVGDKELGSTSYKPYEVMPEGINYNLGLQDNGNYSQFASSDDATTFRFSELLLGGCCAGININNL